MEPLDVKGIEDNELKACLNNETVSINVQGFMIGTDETVAFFEPLWCWIDGLPFDQVTSVIVSTKIGLQTAIKILDILGQNWIL